ncbi:MAG: glucose 1-dehydrogenase [bacterium]|nr:glucose 1-dehydrogenase [bacterium]
MEQLFSLEGKHALVTGGAQGLGRMIAEGLLRAGATVAITSRKQDACDAAAQEMAGLGTCIGLAADLSTPEAATDLARCYGDQFERCDIIINNAGKTWGSPIETFPDKAWASVMAVNVQGPFTLVREMLAILEKSGSDTDPSRIINIGSVAGVKPEGLSAYSYAASKAAVHMLTRDLASDLAPRNITVNAIVPGFFPTRMTEHLREDTAVDPKILGRIPLGRLGRANDIAAAAVFLCSPGAAYITGILLPVDGGIVGCG